MFTVSFKNGVNGESKGEAPLERELSLLAAATKAGVDLTHRCGGHARCGTCVVTIESGADKVSEPLLAERRILQILKAAPEQRLACQAWAQGDVTCAVGSPGKDLRGGK
ncbi:MAG: (2Fe-2S)-binding protein [Holophagaceae bacterium]|nr:(2Fe-2S)-binding protein [Holophagaceae bacterium]